MNIDLLLKAAGQMSASLLLALTVLSVIVVLTAVSYLLLLLFAAIANNQRFARRQKTSTIHPTRRFGIVVPAHNEELVLEATLTSLLKQDYPRDLYEVVVVADNCKDNTAKIAANCGVTVLERHNLTERGKGYALAWAFSHLLNRAEDRTEAYAIVDADTEVAPDFLARMAEFIETEALVGSYALQGRYGVLNRKDGWRASLMAAAFELINHIRPLGADRLNFLVGLKGNGMMFSRDTLKTVTWGHSITEDIDFGLDLLRAGIRMHYVPSAVVQAQMPLSAEHAASQRKRWEMGRFQLIREKALPLVAESFQKKNPQLFEAALSLAIPPLAELSFLMVLGWALLGMTWQLTTAGFQVVPVSLANTVLSSALIGLAVSGVGLAAYILGGLRLAGAGREAYIALLRAPFYAFWKFVLYLSGKKKKTAASASMEWVRTERIAMAPATPLAETVSNATQSARSESSP